MFRRRRYTVQAFHPADYGPYGQRRFRDLERVRAWIDLHRATFPATEFLIYDRVNRYSVTDYPHRRAV